MEVQLQSMNNSLARLSKQINMIQDYIGLKFGADFREYFTNHPLDEVGAATDKINNSAITPTTSTSTRARRSQPQSTISSNLSNFSTNPGVTEAVVLEQPFPIQIKTEDDFFDEMEGMSDDNFDMTDDFVEGVETFGGQEDSESGADAGETPSSAAPVSSCARKRKRPKKRTPKPVDSTTAAESVELAPLSPGLASLAQIVTDYVSKPTFRNQWQFPSEAEYSRIKEVLKRTPGAKSPYKNASARMRKAFKVILNDNGEECVVTKVGNKKLLTRRRFPEEFVKAHDLADSTAPTTTAPGRLFKIVAESEGSESNFETSPKRKRTTFNWVQKLEFDSLEEAKSHIKSLKEFVYVNTWESESGPSLYYRCKLSAACKYRARILFCDDSQKAKLFHTDLPHSDHRDKKPHGLTDEQKTKIDELFDSGIHKVPKIMGALQNSNLITIPSKSQVTARAAYLKRISKRQLNS